MHIGIGISENPTLYNNAGLIEKTAVVDKPTVVWRPLLTEPYEYLHKPYIE